MSTSTATLLRYDDVLERTKKAIQGREDYVNLTYYTAEEAVAAGDAELGRSEKECRYLEPDNAPSCLVGAAFYQEILDAGITFGSEVNTTGVGTLFQEALWDRFQLTERAHSFLTRVQTWQDTGETWGDAVRLAEEVFADYGDDEKALDGRYL